MLKKGLSVLTTISILFLTVSNVCSSAVSADGPVEILSLRSEYGKHFNNGDGIIYIIVGLMEACLCTTT